MRHNPNSQIKINEAFEFHTKSQVQGEVRIIETFLIFYHVGWDTFEMCLGLLNLTNTLLKY